MDLHNRAHPLGVFIKSHEDTVSCLDTLEAIAAALRSCCGEPMPVQRFLSDRAWAFLRSNETVLGAANEDDMHGSCYAHFMRAVEKASHLMNSPECFPALQQDLRDVHDVTDDIVGKVRPTHVSVLE